MYIHKGLAISPCIEQEVFLEESSEPTLQLWAREPGYMDYIPRNVLRRMGKATRMGVWTALSLLKEQAPVDGIVIGTGLGGMEDCIKFLNQIVDYDEGTLTPTNFVQSTPNALAGVLGLMLKNTNYNMTHVGRGGAFEAAVLDACLLLKEDSAQKVLLGSTEEISEYNFNIDKLDGLFKETPIAPSALLSSTSEGSICGEGATMFLVSGNREDATIKLKNIYHRTSDNTTEINEWFQYVMSQMRAKNVSHLILGNNGDGRNDFYYRDFAQHFKSSVIHFKHMTGDYPSSTSFGLYLAYYLAKNKSLPPQFFVEDLNVSPGEIIIYNHYRGEEHSILHLEVC